MALADDARFRAGIDEFNCGNFFEAHEEWEAVWADLIGPEKELCQGLVQIAAGYHKWTLGGVSGARKLLERGLSLVRQSDDSRSGLQLTAFCTAVAGDLDGLKRLPVLTGATPPKMGPTPYLRLSHT